MQNDIRESTHTDTPGLHKQEGENIRKNTRGNKKRRIDNEKNSI